MSDYTISKIKLTTQNNEWKTVVRRHYNKSTIITNTILPMNPETSTSPEFFDGETLDPTNNDSSLFQKIEKTVNGNYVAVMWNGEPIFFDKEGNFYSGSMEDIGAASGKLRSDSAVYAKIAAQLQKREEIKANFVPVEKIGTFEVLFERSTLNLVLDVNGSIIPIDKSSYEKIKTQYTELKKLQVKFSKPTGMSYKLGDRVLLWWPTGTGKTFDYISASEDLISSKKIDASEIVTITDGFEDIDFLAYIVPTEDGGIRYEEKAIVSLLRDASKGKRVAILLDELNRGSKSFLNLILKLLDAVDGKTYTLNNFIKDEQIIIPIENVMFFATMNLGGKYVGTNALDEALLDRFNKVIYKTYNLENEKKIITTAFGTYSSAVLQIVDHVRKLHSSGEIRAPISTRGVKMWAEEFYNSWKSQGDIHATFESVLLYRLVNVDDYGNPNTDEMSLILKKFKDLKII